MKIFISFMLSLLLICTACTTTANDEIETPTAEPIEIEVVTPTPEPIEVKPIVEVEPVKTVDPEDLEILAHLLVGEAGSDWCSDEMIYYVGSVVLNRVAAKDFPNTIEGVVFQKGQYACTWDGNYDRKPSERHYRIAEDLLLNGSLLPEDVVFQAEFKQGSAVYAKVQNMYFCYRYYWN